MGGCCGGKEIPEAAQTSAAAPQLKPAAKPTAPTNNPPSQPKPPLQPRPSSEKVDKGVGNDMVAALAPYSNKDNTENDDEVVVGGGEREVLPDPGGESAPKDANAWWNRNKTQREPKQVKGIKATTLKATMVATLGKGDLRKVVKCPDGEDVNEWISVNTINFFNMCNSLFAMTQDFCTDVSCPRMTAGPTEYLLWPCGFNNNKASHTPAPIYCEKLLEWIEQQVNDTTLFPIEEGTPFPRNFLSSVKQIYKRMFRLFAHLYYHHLESMRSVGGNAHLNTCFKHFILFSNEYNLVGQDALAPMAKYVNSILTTK
jgi:MOB kinase activator 1